MGCNCAQREVYRPASTQLDGKHLILTLESIVDPPGGVVSTLRAITITILIINASQ
jgi:hypothetical protein